MQTKGQSELSEWPFIDYLNKLVEKLKIPDLKHPVLSYSMGFAELCCAILVIAAALAL